MDRNWARAATTATFLCIWNTPELETVRAPIATYPGHQSNIFCIAFASNSNHIYSCANDSLLLRHDANRGILGGGAIDGSSGAARRRQRNRRSYQPLDEILAHNEMAVLKLSIHPEEDQVVLTSGQDGTIALWDFRAKKHEQGRLTSMNSQNCVTFNPTMPNLFLTCDEAGGIFLRDLRKSFTTTTTNPSPLLQHYNTTLSTGPHTSNPLDTTSVAFSPCGTMFGATFQKWYPALYSLRDPFPLAFFKSIVDGVRFHGPTASTARVRSRRVLLGGGGVNGVEYLRERRYGGSIGGEGYVFGCGSDDRYAYVWEVPGREWVKEKREEVNPYLSLLGMWKGVLFADRVPLIVTAGVEKVVRIHSNYAFGDYDEEKDNKKATVPRPHGLRPGPPDPGNSTEEDLHILMDFDRLVIRECSRNTVWDAPDGFDFDSSDGDDDDDEDDMWDDDDDDVDDFGGLDVDDGWETEIVGKQLVTMNMDMIFWRSWGSDVGDDNDDEEEEDWKGSTRISA
ncbi:WD40 repeat-like protein [Rhizoclosmatium globosum]|uniref:WD40 repeat-like protein n=1 Tax=Rhizoclosmatium globosum TaxID=329046 RepID=A0A1Y2C9A6_9FUNG|nr:WD40 repeat-like protein [Rhizoclosmatium globosum]|eukprot:ORY43622.1 WD40 repeat-like protein [Rhizoclosmatium globosum]